MLSRVLLVDANQLLTRAAFSQGRSLGLKEAAYGPTTVYTSLGLLRQMVYRFLPLYAVLVWDGQRSVRRQELLPTYKSGRPIPTDEQIQLKWMDIGRVVSVAKGLGCRSLLVKSKEADDVIGYIARRCTAPTIASSDRDFLQLVQFGASCWFPDKDKYVNAANFYEEFRVLPNQYLLYKAIIGDSGDAIPGVKGVGEKTVLPILQSNPRVEAFSDVRRICEHSVGRREKILWGSEQTVARNLQLMDLSRELFYPEEEDTVKACLSGAVQFEDASMHEMKKLGMGIIEDIWTDWSAPFRRLI